MTDDGILQNPRILLIVSGGIAAYKALDLIRRLRDQGCSVRVILTQAAMQFITPLAASSLSGQKVYSEIFSLTDEAEIGHIRLSREADLVLVAPATADLMAKMASGHADDLASTVLLATDKRVLIAPSMNVRMWEHAATQRNVATLKSDGVLFIGPAEGDMACGEYGLGRLSEITEIVEAVMGAVSGSTNTSAPVQSLKGKHVLVTAGPTHEPIDDVRYIANRSSGKQGYAIAHAAKMAGARVTLVSGPTHIAPPEGVAFISVSTAQQMRDATIGALPADVFIGSAAVADWRVKKVAHGKIKKSLARPPQFDFVENPDILAEVSKSLARPRLVIGFAAETDSLIQHAQDKLSKKGCDIIVANDVSPGTDVMGGEENTVHVVRSTGVESWPKATKTEVAQRLVALCSTELSK